MTIVKKALLEKSIYLFAFLIFHFHTYSQVGVELQVLSAISACNEQEISYSLTVSNQSDALIKLTELSPILSPDFAYSSFQSDSRRQVDVGQNGQIQILNLLPCESINIILNFKQLQCFSDTLLCLRVLGAGISERICSQVASSGAEITDLSLKNIGIKTYERSFNIINNSLSSISEFIIELSRANGYNILESNLTSDFIVDDEIALFGNKNNVFEPGEIIHIRQIIVIKECTEDLIDEINLLLPCKVHACNQIGAKSSQTIFDYRALVNGVKADYDYTVSENCEGLSFYFTFFNTSQQLFRNPTYSFNVYMTDGRVINVDEAFINNQALESENLFFHGNNTTFEDSALIAADGDFLKNDIGPLGSFQLVGKLNGINPNNVRSVGLNFTVENNCGNTLRVNNLPKPILSTNFSQNYSTMPDPDIVLTGPRRTMYDGDTLKIHYNFNHTRPNDCQSPLIKFAAYIPGWLIPLADSLLLTNRYIVDSIYNELDSTYGPTIKRVTTSWPYEIIGDSLYFSFNKIQANDDLFEMIFRVNSPPRNTGQDCISCIPIERYNLKSRITIHCPGGCQENIELLYNYNNESEMPITVYNSPLEKQGIEKSKFLVESSTLVNYTSVFDDNQNPIDSAFDTSVIPRDSLKEMAVIKTNFECDLTDQDSIFINCYFSDRVNTYSHFDMALDITIVKSSGAIYNMLADPTEIKGSAVPVYGMTGNIEIFRYDIADFLRTHNFNNQDSIIISRRSRLSNLDKSLRFGHVAHEIEISNASCKQKSGKNLPIKFTTTQAKFEVEFNTKSLLLTKDAIIAPDYDGELYRLTIDFNFVNQASSSPTNHGGSKSFVVFDSLVFFIRKDVYLNIGNQVFHPDGTQAAMVRQSDQGSFYKYAIYDIELIEQFSTNNVFQLNAYFEHYFHQQTLIEFTYYYKEKDLTTQAFIPKILTANQIVNAINYTTFVENNVKNFSAGGQSEWLIQARNISNFNSAASVPFYGNYRNLFGAWFLVEKDPSTHISLFDSTQNITIIPTIESGRYAFYKVRDLSSENYYRLIVVNENCKTNEIRLYAGFSRDSIASNVFDFALAHLDEYFPAILLKQIEQIDNFKVLDYAFKLKEDCSNIKFTASFTHFGSEDFQLKGIRVNGFTPLDESNFTTSDGSMGELIVGDTIFLSNMLTWHRLEEDTLSISAYLALPCPYIDNVELSVDVLYEDLCGLLKSKRVSIGAIQLLEELAPSEIPIVVRLSEASSTCFVDRRMQIQIDVNQAQSAGFGFMLKPPKSIDIINHLEVDDARLYFQTMPNGELLVLANGNINAGEQLTWTLVYDNACDIACTSLPWSMAVMSRNQLCSCPTLRAGKDTIIEVAQDLLVDLIDVIPTTVNNEHIGLTFQKIDPALLNPLTITLFADLDKTGTMSPGDELIEEKSISADTLKNGEKEITFDFNYGGKKCDLLVLITNDCACDSIVLSLQTPLTQALRTSLYPVCIIDSLIFNLNLRPGEIANWPEHEHLFNTNSGGGVYFHPDIENNDSIMVEATDSYGCIEEYLLLFSPGVKDLKINTQLLEGCAAVPTFSVEIEALTTISEIYIDDRKIDNFIDLTLGSGTYTVVLTDDFNCKVQRTLILEGKAKPQIKNLQITDVSCFGRNDGVVSFSIEGGIGEVQTTFDGQMVNDTLFTALFPGTYLLMAQDSMACRDTVMIEIAGPLQVLLQNDQVEAFCTERKIKKEDIDALFQGLDLLYSFDSTAFHDDEFLTATTADNLQRLFVKDSLGCVYDYLINLVPVAPRLPEFVIDETAYREFEMAIELLEHNYWSDVLWTSEDFSLPCMSCPSILFFTNNNGSVYWSATDENSCLQQETINIVLNRPQIDSDLFPNIMSLSASDPNNKFIDFGLENRLINRVLGASIYDRFGNVMWSKQEAPFLWDGQFRGQFVESGVYIYKVEVELRDEDKSIQIISGTVTFVRN